MLRSIASPKSRVESDEEDEAKLVEKGAVVAFQLAAAAAAGGVGTAMVISEAPVVVVVKAATDPVAAIVTGADVAWRGISSGVLAAAAVVAARGGILRLPAPLLNEPCCEREVPTPKRWEGVMGNT
jgi:hypothetical protein